MILSKFLYSNFHLSISYFKFLILFLLIFYRGSTFITKIYIEILNPNEDLIINPEEDLYILSISSSSILNYNKLFYSTMKYFIKTPSNLTYLNSPIPLPAFTTLESSEIDLNLFDTIEINSPTNLKSFIISDNNCNYNSNSYINYYNKSPTSSSTTSSDTSSTSSSTSSTSSSTSSKYNKECLENFSFQLDITNKLSKYSQLYIEIQYFNEKLFPILSRLPTDSSYGFHLPPSKISLIYYKKNKNNNEYNNNSTYINNDDTTSTINNSNFPTTFYSSLSINQNNFYVKDIYTNSYLINYSFPDPSMPFNVTTLVSKFFY